MWHDSQSLRAEQVNKDVGDGKKMWNQDGPWGTVTGVWHPKGATVSLDSEMVMKGLEICNCVNGMSFPGFSCGQAHPVGLFRCPTIPNKRQHPALVDAGH